MRCGVFGLLSFAVVASACQRPVSETSANPMQSVEQAEAAVRDAGVDCAEDSTTLDMVLCTSLDLARENQRLEQYLALAETVFLADDAEGRTQLRQAQAAWRDYADRECESVGRQFEGGSIRPVMVGSCLVSLTHERTRTVWRHHLQYMDSTPPPAPEPVHMVSEELATRN